MSKAITIGTVVTGIALIAIAAFIMPGKKEVSVSITDLSALEDVTVPQKIKIPVQVVNEGAVRSRIVGWNS